MKKRAWKKNIWTGNFYHDVSENKRVWRCPSGGLYTAEYWGTFTPGKFPAQALFFSVLKAEKWLGEMGKLLDDMHRDEFTSEQIEKFADKTRKQVEK